MNLKYNWDELPKWANYAAIDEDESLFVYEDKPLKQKHVWVQNLGSSEFIEMHEEGGDWETSLEQRPSLDDTRESIIAIIKTVLQQVEVDAENYGEEIACSIIAERSADMILERLGLKNKKPCE